MGSSILQLEQVRKAIQEVYQLPERAESYLELQKAIQLWEKAFGGEEDDENRRIFDGLQSLHAFLNNKGLASEALQIFYLQITVFLSFISRSCRRGVRSKSSILSSLQVCGRHWQAKPHLKKSGRH